MLETGFVGLLLLLSCLSWAVWNAETDVLEDFTRRCRRESTRTRRFLRALRRRG